MDIKLESASFNSEHWSAYSENEFVEQCLAEGMFANYAHEDRRALLIKAHQLIRRSHDSSRYVEET